MATFGHEVAVLPPRSFDHLGLKSLHLAMRAMGNNVASTGALHGTAVRCAPAPGGPPSPSAQPASNAFGKPGSSATEAPCLRKACPAVRRQNNTKPFNISRLGARIILSQPLHHHEDLHVEGKSRQTEIVVLRAFFFGGLFCRMTRGYPKVFQPSFV